MDDVALVPLARHVRGGEDEPHARHGQSLGGVDAQHLHPGLGGAQHGAVQHARTLHVVHVEARAQDLLPGVGPADAGAHTERGGGFPGHREVLPQEPRGLQHRLFDLHIARAPAHVQGQGLGHVLGTGIRVGIQQTLGADHHARDAEPALDRAGLGERPGIDILLPRREPFQREDALALQLGRVEQAGPGGLAVHQHHAGAAGSFRATVLHRGEVQFVPEEVQEVPFLRRDNFAAVDLKRGHLWCLSNMQETPWRAGRNRGPLPPPRSVR